MVGSRDGRHDGILGDCGGVDRVGLVCECWLGFSNCAKISLIERAVLRFFSLYRERKSCDFIDSILNTFLQGSGLPRVECDLVPSETSFLFLFFAFSFLAVFLCFSPLLLFFPVFH